MKFFMDKYHLQGSTSHSIVGFKLIDPETSESLAMITGGRHHRGTNENVLVLDRLCFAEDVHIVGGSARLLKSLIEWAKSHHYATIISWSDNRWSDGQIYEHLGFLLEGELPPDYFYVKNYRRHSKQSLRKTKEEKAGNKTEHELRLEQGYLRIYDCGKKRWKMDLK
jgi:hypothetical protein